MAFCQYCGSPIEDTARYCIKCGRKVSFNVTRNEDPQQRQSSFSQTLVDSNDLIFDRYVSSNVASYDIQDQSGTKIGDAVQFPEHQHVAFKIIDIFEKCIVSSVQTKIFDTHGEFAINDSSGSNLASIRRPRAGVGIASPLVFVIEQNGQEYARAVEGPEGSFWKRNYQIERNNVPVVTIRSLEYGWGKLKFAFSIIGDVGHEIVLASIPVIDFEIAQMKVG